MRKILFAGLMAALLMTGCAVYDADETSAITTQPSTLETLPGTYVQNSKIEEQTDGAVRLYVPDTEDAHWIAMLGENLLLASGQDSTVLTVFAGDDGIATSVTLDADVSKGSYQMLDNGLAYYVAEKQQAVFLNPQLQETYRVQLPDTIIGEPTFAPDGSEVYYCQDQEIRAYDVENNISRPVKTHGCKEQSLLGCHFDGTMLACRVTYESGETTTLYISTQTGQTLALDNSADVLVSYGKQYLVCRMDGIVRQRVFGELDATQVQINCASDPVPALELGGVLLYENNTECFVNLSTGKEK